MIGQSTQALVRNIAQTHRSLGLTMPTAFDTAEKNLTLLTQNLSTMRGTAGDLAAAVATAMLDDRNPATDPEVTRLVITERITDEGLTYLIREQTEAQLTQALTDNIDPLINQWTTLFNASAKNLAASAETLGNVNIERDADVILNRGGDIAHHFVTARDATATIKSIQGMWMMTANLTRFASLNPDMKTLIISPVPLDDWEHYSMRGAKHTAWQLHHLGLPLDLATRTGYRARTDAHQATAEARATQYRDSLKPLAGLSTR